MKRFVRKTKFRFEKISDYIEIPLKLNIDPFTIHKCIKLNTKFNQSSNKKKDNKRNKELNEFEFNPGTNAYYQYDLYAMVVHGGTMNGGHYVSYVKLKQELKFQKLLKYYHKK